MNPSLKVKFAVKAVTPEQGSVRVSLTAVKGNPEVATVIPADLQISLVNPVEQALFVVGKEYYLDFSPIV